MADVCCACGGGRNDSIPRSTYTLSTVVEDVHTAVYSDVTLYKEPCFYVKAHYLKRYVDRKTLLETAVKPVYNSEGLAPTMSPSDTTV